MDSKIFSSATVVVLAWKQCKNMTVIDFGTLRRKMSYFTNVVNVKNVFYIRTSSVCIMRFFTRGENCCIVNLVIVDFRNAKRL
jgi:hypothetical protein